ncbi:MAG: DUF4105 domain-containing protein [bacterium]|nr:DUF4105 domain-containing protein [bacterium]
MRLIRILIGAAVALAILWGGAAVWFDGPTSRPAAGGLALGFVVLSLGLLLRVRPAVRGLAGFGLLFLLVLFWWGSLEPSNDRVWTADVAHPATVSFDGDRATIQNVRNFRFRSETDFDPVWEERTIDLSKVTGIDFYLIYWGSPLIAHTIVSWTFEDGPPLAISIETRKEADESYSAVLGFFRQFELYYVVADERDVIGLRTHHRGEDVYLYRLQTSAKAARALLVDYLETIDRLAQQPRWYNAASHNCTTTIRRHVQHLAADRPFDWRILVNGRLDELGYERGTVDTSLPFDELRRVSAISARAQTSPIDAGFSARIRDGLPGGR